MRASWTRAVASIALTIGLSPIGCVIACARTTTRAAGLTAPTQDSQQQLPPLAPAQPLPPAQLPAPPAATPPSTQTPATTAAPAATDGSHWQIYYDRVENAYSMAVPAGWTVTGGLQRISQVEVRAYVRVVSPDGSIEIFSGDQNVPYFLVPNQTTMMQGLQVGMTYTVGGQPFMIEPYLNGSQFASGWGARRVMQSCATPFNDSGQELPQVSQGVNYAYTSAGMTMNVDAGEAHFTCNGPTAPDVGYIFAATQEGTLPSGAQLWIVNGLGGYIARTDEEGTAEELLIVMMGSLRLNPQWIVNQQRGNAGTAVIATNARNAAAQALDASFQAYNASAGRSNNNFAAYQRGIAMYHDSDEGDIYLVNFAHQWRLPDGTLQGTDSDEPPVAGAVELPRSMVK